jgi:hypothetical protein
VKLVQGSTDIRTGDAAVLVATPLETQEVTPKSGVYGPGPFNGEVFQSPKLKGDLKAISDRLRGGNYAEFRVTMKPGAFHLL